MAMCTRCFDEASVRRLGMAGARRFVALMLMIAAAAASGCGSGDSAVEMPPGAQSDPGDDTSTEFRAVLGNALTDTLAGNADFGKVVEPVSGSYRFIIRLNTAFDFAGGIVFSRSDTSLPSTGDYPLEAPTDTLTAASPAAFAMFYREGMLRDLRAVSGTLTLSTATDTLIVGRFDATLRGTVASLNIGSTSAEVHATGRFRAGRELQGYVIGL